MHHLAPLSTLGLLGTLGLLAGCSTTLSPGKVAVIANGPNNEFLWLTREVTVSDGLFAKRQHTVIFLCERTADHPQCYAAELHPSKRADLFWPTGMPCPLEQSCHDQAYSLKRAPQRPRPAPAAKPGAELPKSPPWADSPSKQ